MRLSVPDDWSSRHVIFSGARTARAAARMQYEPRYWHQWLRHNRPLPQGVQAPAAVGQYSVPGMTSMFVAAQRAAAAGGKAPNPGATSTTALRRTGVRRCWRVARWGTGMFPAKYTFDITATPSCTSDYAAFNTSLVGGAGAKASQTGTFTASSLTGTVVVGGTTLTASPGTAASQSTTISANGVVGGNTITITNSPASLTLTASDRVRKWTGLAFDGTVPDDNSFVTVAGIQYTFKTANWVSGSMPATQCFIRTAATLATMVSSLAAAITNGSANTGASVSTWQCGTSATQPSNGVTVTSPPAPPSTWPPRPQARPASRQRNREGQEAITI